MDERSRESSHPGAVGRSRGWKLDLGFGVLAAFLYMLVPPLKGNAIFFNAFGLTSWLAVIVGIRRNRPSYATPWWLVEHLTDRGVQAAAGRPGALQH